MSFLQTAQFLTSQGKKLTRSNRLMAINIPGIALSAAIANSPLLSAWCEFIMNAYFKSMVEEANEHPGKDGEIHNILVLTRPLTNATPSERVPADCIMKPLDAILFASRLDIDALIAAVRALSRAERSLQLGHGRVEGPFQEFCESKEFAARVKGAADVVFANRFDLPIIGNIPASLLDDLAKTRDRLEQELTVITPEKVDTGYIRAEVTLRIEMLLLSVTMQHLCGADWFDAALVQCRKIIGRYTRRLEKNRRESGFSAVEWCQDAWPPNDSALVQAALAVYQEARAAARQRFANDPATALRDK